VSDALLVGGGAVLGLACFAGVRRLQTGRWPRWALALPAGALGLLGLAAGRRRPPPALPPPAPTVEHVGRTAGDILREKAQRDAARIHAASSGAAAEQELAELVDARRRR